jgi:hypothetical protein
MVLKIVLQVFSVFKIPILKAGLVPFSSPSYALMNHYSIKKRVRN